MPLAVTAVGDEVELGGGTGALAEAVLSTLPNIRLEIWDIDAKMLAVAEDRLRKFEDRIALREKSFTEKLTECHAVIATLSLHHVPTLDAKSAVYRNIFEVLSEGGIFLNGDCTMDMTEPTHGVMLQYWLDFMAKHGITEAEGRNHLADWAKEDTYQQCLTSLAFSRKPGFAVLKFIGETHLLPSTEASKATVAAVREAQARQRAASRNRPPLQSHCNGYSINECGLLQRIRRFEWVFQQPSNLGCPA